MGVNGKRKESYKVRKIGEYNYSVTLPPSAIEYIGGYTDNLYLNISCNNNRIVLQNKTLMESSNRLYLNPICPMINYNNIYIGYNTFIEAYFITIDKNNNLFSSKKELSNYLILKSINIPGILITQLYEYIDKLLIK